MNRTKRKRYAINWEFISAYIRYERAKNKCESCGLTNGTIIRRLPNNKVYELNFDELTEVQKFMQLYKLHEKQALKKLKLTKVNLSVAHLNQDENDNDYSNLKALCQKCHLTHDRDNNRFRAKTYRQLHIIPIHFDDEVSPDTLD